MVQKAETSTDQLVRLFGLAGKKALIVGGGLGMGRESARLLALAGASLAIVDIEEGRAQAVAAEIVSRGGQAVPIVADALDRTQVEGVLRRVVRELGDLDLLVTIVGMPTVTPLIAMTDDAFETDLTRNLRYVFWWARGFAQLLDELHHGGVIVSVASVSGLQASPNRGAYGAAKAGLISLTKTMAVEWGGRGIRVNSVAPGATTTDRVQRPPDVNARLSEFIPLGRPGDQTDIAKAVLFLASDLSGYITGQTLVVDGGATIKPGYQA